MRQPAQQTDPLEPGDILPRLSLTGPRGEVVDTSAPPMAGRINFLVFGGGDTARTSALLADLATQRHKLETLGARCFLVTRPIPTGASSGGEFGLPGLGTRALPGLGGASLAKVPDRVIDIGELKAGAMRLVDPGGEVFRFLSAENGPPVLLVVGANLHVIDIVRAAKPSTDVERIVNKLENRVAGNGFGTPVIHPPVLAVPDVFNAVDTAHLMSIFHTRGHEYVEPGHSALGDRTTDCKMRIPDLGRRDRIDHWVVEAATQAFISDRLRKRLFPEIQKAFNYPITQHERYRLARYEGDRGGEQMGHRDNVDPSVAHRRFAVTINLNAEAYEGGELRFPEFSEQLYKPPSGTAIVFSCSLLHEVVGMRTGSRFALLAFLFGAN
jgi:hypothetical protein